MKHLIGLFVSLFFRPYFSMLEYRCRAENIKLFAKWNCSIFIVAWKFDLISWIGKNWRNDVTACIQRTNGAATLVSAVHWPERIRASYMCRCISCVFSKTVQLLLVLMQCASERRAQMIAARNFFVPCERIWVTTGGNMRQTYRNEWRMYSCSSRHIRPLETLLTRWIVNE